MHLKEIDLGAYYFLKLWKESKCRMDDLSAPTKVVSLWLPYISHVLSFLPRIGQYWDQSMDAMAEEHLLTDKALEKKMYTHRTYLQFLVHSDLMSKVTNETKTYLLDNHEKLVAAEELSLSILSNPDDIEEEDKRFDSRFLAGMRECIKEVSKGWGGARGGLHGTDIFFHEAKSLVVNLSRVLDKLRKESGGDLWIAISVVRLLSNVIKEVEDIRNLLNADYQVRAFG